MVGPVLRRGGVRRAAVLPQKVSLKKNGGFSEVTVWVRLVSLGSNSYSVDTWYQYNLDRFGSHLVPEQKPDLSGIVCFNLRSVVSQASCPRAFIIKQTRQLSPCRKYAYMHVYICANHCRMRTWMPGLPVCMASCMCLRHSLSVFVCLPHSLSHTQTCCAVEECKERTAPIIGDCKYCQAKYCANHRLPEVRAARSCACQACARALPPLQRGARRAWGLARGWALIECARICRRTSATA